MLQDHLYIIINENQEMSWKEFCGQGRPALSQLHFCEARGSPRVPHASCNFPHLHLWEPRENPRAVSVPGNPTWAGEKVVGEGVLGFCVLLANPHSALPSTLRASLLFVLRSSGLISSCTLLQLPLVTRSPELDKYCMILRMWDI